MTHLTVPIVYAFIDGDSGGNPAGVVLDAEPYSPQDRQRIAARVGLSETAFVTPARNSDGFRVEFFTPNRQIADCGHATVAVFFYLAQQGRIDGIRSVKELSDGAAHVIDLIGDRTFMGQTVPQFTPLSDALFSAMLHSLALTPADLLPDAPPMVAHNGVNGLLIPVRDAATLRRIVPDFDAIHAVSDTLDLVEYYVFSSETLAPDRDAGARMFAPRYGIPEEAATGMAAGPLSCYLHDFLGLRKPRIVIEQGFFMTPPARSELIAELALESDTITALRVGGRARVSHTLEFDW